jgi:transcriptional regulator with XRE-family HTH domain
MQKPTHRRLELGQFLQSRRARLAPPPGAAVVRRRRTAGLTREEVAAAASISATWYTWLEQGRDIRVSPPALGRIADALKLDDGERSYLFTLAEQAVPRRWHGEDVPVALQAMLDGMGLNPVYLTNHCWDVLLWSPAATLGFIDYTDAKPAARNVVYDFFSEPRRRVEFVDWERHARRIVAEFRASYGRHPDDPRFAPLIKRCCEVSSEFARWWAEHEVQDRYPGLIERTSPELGRLSFSYTSFAPSDAGALRMTIYTPADDRTRDALAGALRNSA